MQNVKKQRRKRVIRSVIHVSIALIISIIPLFCCAFSTNAYYQEYLTMLEPAASGLYSVDSLNGIFIDIGTNYGFSNFTTINNFSTEYNQSLKLYRYRTSSLYPIDNTARIDYASIFDLSRGVFFQAGNTYRFRFYVEAGTGASKYFWWEDKTPEEIENYKNAYLYKGEYSKFYLSYIELGSERIALIPANVSTMTIGDSNLRYICFYDFTITLPAGVSNPQLVINCSFNFRDDFVGTTQFTCGVSQCSVYQVYESSADAPIFPGLDDSVVDDFNNQSSQLEDFAASQESVISGYLNPDFSGAPEFTEAMLGISHIIDKYVFRMEPVQRILGMGVAIGLICVLFGIGAVYARALERDKRDRYNRSYEKYASDRARREQYAQRYNKEKKGD